MTVLLLLAILITLLGGGVIVGYALLVLATIWIIVSVALYFSTSGENSDGSLLTPKKTRIKQLERAIAKKRDLGYEAEELVHELDDLRGGTPSEFKPIKNNAYKVSFGEGFLDAFTFGSVYEKRRLRRAIRHKKSLGYDTSELEERLRKL